MLAVLPAIGWTQPAVGELATEFTLTGEVYKPGATRLWVFAVTLGQNWSGFPVYGTYNFDTNPMQFTGGVWVTGYSQSHGLLAGQWQPFQQPVHINDPDRFPWMTTQRILGLQLYSRQGGYCCWYHACPASLSQPDFDPSHFQGCNTEECCPNGYCPYQLMYENPLQYGAQYPMDASGNITLTDAHGGSQSQMWGELHGLFPIDDQMTEVRYVFVYQRPGRFTNWGDAPPGTTVPLILSFSFNGVNMTVRPSALTVHHVSPDIPWSTPGSIDAGDLANLAAGLGKGACYGLINESSPCPTCHWWYTDIAPNGCTDWGDLSLFASIPLPYTCDIGKATAAAVDRARMLRWFGLEYTGQQIPVGLDGTLVPEVGVVDEAKMQHAIQDPFGYQNETASATKQTWSLIKQVYR
jgi:hypothetical protein